MLKFYWGILAIRCFCEELRKMFSCMALRLGKKLSFAVMAELICCKFTFIKWMRDSWFHFDSYFIFLIRLTWWAWSPHPPCRSGLSLLSWNIFYFFDRKKKWKVEVRQCTCKEMLPNWQLYSQDLNKLPFCPKIPICIIIDFYLSMPAYGSFCWIGNKTVFVYVYVLETVAMDLQRVFYLIYIKL